MATVKLTFIQKNTLQRAQFTPMRSKPNNIVTSLLEVGFISISRNLPIYSEYAITPAGLAYLYQDAPMVDQPQPYEIKVGDRVTVGFIHGGSVKGQVIAIYGKFAVVKDDDGDTLSWFLYQCMLDQSRIDAATIEGEVNFYADGKAQDGTIVAGTDKYGYIVRGVNGTVYDEVKRGDIEPRLADELDDLPFSDLGEPDDEDTKELPAITVDAPKPTLSNLIDAALNPDDTDAYAALKSYDWASVPLWVLEIERDDVNTYKWEIWHELRKMDGGIRLSTPEAVYKNREVDRAFNVMAILNDAIYNFHKGVGFNVEN